VAVVDAAGTIVVAPTAFEEDAAGYQVLHELLGAAADTLLLRQLCERHGALATTMPTAQAVLLNLDELMPYLGDAVRAAAAHHYRVGAR